MKTCTTCKKIKPFSDFYTDAYKKDGHKYACIKCHNAYNNRLRSSNPEIHRKANLEYSRSTKGRELLRLNNLRRKYWPHLSNEEAGAEYEKLLVFQEHCCGLCGKHKSKFKTALAVDHEHKTGKVRGLLCNKCNRFEVGRHTLQSARNLVAYFETHEDRGNPMKRVWHPYTLWEDYINGMWRDVSKGERAEYLEKAVEFTGDHNLYGSFMRRVIKEWPISCEHNLTSKSTNRRAWVGHAAACLALSIPEDITREAWWMLTQVQRDLADAQADVAIAEWERTYEG